MAERQPLPWESEGETLAVETPEQTAIELSIAPFGTRLVAALLDQLILLAAYVLLGLLVLVAIVLAAGWDEDAAGLAIAAGLIGWFLLSSLAPTWWEIRGEGRTPGKRRLRLRTVMATGQGLSLQAALLRNLARLVDQVPVLWLIPALSPGRRRIGDYLAGTLVVSEAPPPSEARGPDWIGRLAPSYAELVDRRFFFPAEVLGRLRPQDLDLLEYLGERLPTLPSHRRRRFLRECAQQYVQRLGMETERERVAADPPRFLQELGLLLRERFRDRTF